jgi:hypothetical protein
MDEEIQKSTNKLGIRTVLGLAFTLGLVVWGYEFLLFKGVLPLGSAWDSAIVLRQE